MADCSEDAVGGLIAAIDASVSMNCADIYISDDVAYGLISTHIYMDGLIATPIKSTDCSDTNVSDDAVDILTMLMC